MKDASPPYEIRWIASEKDAPDAVWEVGFSGPVEGRWWYRALERAGLDDQFSFHYALILDGETVVGIAPAFTMDVPMRLVVPPELLPLVEVVGKAVPSLLYQRTLFVGSPCSEEGRIGLIPGADPLRAVRAVTLAIREKARSLKAPMRVWKDFPEETRALLEKVSAAEGLFKVVSFPSTIVDFKGQTLESYYAQLKSSRRNKLNKKMKQARAAPLDVRVVQNPDQALMAEIWSLFWKTYEKGTTKFERLTPRFFTEIAAFETSHFLLLTDRISGRLCAFMLLFKCADRSINKFIGIDYDRPKDWFLYFRLWEEAVIWSLSWGARQIQSGQTAYAPKIEIGNRLEPLTNFCAHANPVVHWVYKTVGASVNWDSLDPDLAAYLKAYPEEKPSI